MCVLCDCQSSELGTDVSVRGYSEGIMGVPEVTEQLLCVRGNNDNIMSLYPITDIMSVSEVKMSASYEWLRSQRGYYLTISVQSENITLMSEVQ